jgi:hypothetical protein
MAENANAQQELENLLVKTLTDASWKKTDRGEKLGKAEMEFNNGKVTLQMGTAFEPGQVAFAIFESPEEGSDFVLDCPDKLADVLKTVISFQNQISFDDYKQYLSQLVQVCPKTYVDTGDDLVPLIDEDDDDDDA